MKVIKSRPIKLLAAGLSLIALLYTAGGCVAQPTPAEGVATGDDGGAENQDRAGDHLPPAVGRDFGVRTLAALWVFLRRHRTGRRDQRAPARRLGGGRRAGAR